MATNIRTPRTDKYELGYLPKIEYWTSELATDPTDHIHVSYCVEKIAYFTGKEKERQLKLKK